MEIYKKTQINNNRFEGLANTFKELTNPIKNIFNLLGEEFNKKNNKQTNSTTNDSVKIVLVKLRLIILKALNIKNSTDADLFLDSMTLLTKKILNKKIR